MSPTDIAPSDTSGSSACAVVDGTSTARTWRGTRSTSAANRRVSSVPIAANGQSIARSFTITCARDTPGCTWQRWISAVTSIPRKRELFREGNVEFTVILIFAQKRVDFYQGCVNLLLFVRCRKWKTEGEKKKDLVYAWIFI